MLEIISFFVLLVMPAAALMWFSQNTPTPPQWALPIIEEENRRLRLRIEIIVLIALILYWFVG